jgi:transcriptional regulator with XRE-family HTH domain
VPTDPGPMVRRRQLGSALRRYRNAAGLSVKEVAERLLCSPSKISRIETAQRNATLRDVRDLCDMYGISDEIIRKELMDLARDSRERGWWQEANLDAALETLIGMEGAASAIREYENLALPGLLQTRDYALAMLRAWRPSGDSAARLPAIDVRMRRQEILARESRPTFHVVLDEAAVRRVVGGTEVMGAQITHLIELMESSVVQLQLIPFTAGAHVGMNNGFTILEFTDAAIPVSDSTSSVVYVEGAFEDTYNDRISEVRRYTAAFTSLSAQALPEIDTLDLLRTLVRHHHGD